MNLNEMLIQKDYKNVLQNFCALSAVPRGSGYNQKISDWICHFAKEHGIRYEQDEALNVILRKPATAGYGSAPSVLLQGHMDMVCVKDEGCAHDFLTEGLELLTDGELLYANGTTLGADNGVAIAYMLSLLTDESLEHPELICLITTDEETGMDGARAVNADKIRADYLINLDSEEEGICWCGCAGGQRLEVKLPIVREQLPAGVCMTVRLGGLSGGHSGADIHKYIPNAIRVLGRFLAGLDEVADCRLIRLAGGEKDNSIPVNASASLLVTDADSALEAAKNVADTLVSIYGRSQPGMRFQFHTEEISGEEKVLDMESQKKLLFLLNQIPDGVQGMSTQIPGLVETSLNLGIFTMDDANGVFHFSLRSSVAEELKYLSKKVVSLAESAGAVCETGSDYPAWEYRSESKLRTLFCDVFEQLYKERPRTAVIHAGLECGLLSEKLPDTDMISVGPNMHDIHTPKERLETTSMLRVYRVLEQILIQIRN